MSTHPARRRQLRTWSPAEQQEHLQAVAAGSEHCSVTGRELLDLASNDYLSLCRHPSLIAAAESQLRSSGVGSGGSRLVSGSRPVHGQLESELACWLGRERVLLFPSGFQANLAAVSALANRHTTVVADRLIHPSLWWGFRPAAPDCGVLPTTISNHWSDFCCAVAAIVRRHPCL